MSIPPPFQKKLKSSQKKYVFRIKKTFRVIFYVHLHIFNLHQKNSNFIFVLEPPPIYLQTRAAPLVIFISKIWTRHSPNDDEKWRRNYDESSTALPVGLSGGGEGGLKQNKNESWWFRTEEPRKGKSVKFFETFSPRLSTTSDYNNFSFAIIASPQRGADFDKLQTPKLFLKDIVCVAQVVSPLPYGIVLRLEIISTRIKRRFCEFQPFCVGNVENGLFQWT